MDIEIQTDTQNVILQGPKPRKRLPEPWKEERCVWTNEEKEEKRFFENVEIKPTKFLDIETLTTLGIHDDVVSVLKEAGLGCLATMEEPVYVDEVVDFLSTLTLDLTPKKKPRALWGKVSFKIKNKIYTMGVIDICEIYGMPLTDLAQTPNWSGKDDFWDYIAYGSFTGNSPKGSLIRNPSLRVVQKLLASTIFGKDKTGGVSRNELILLFRGVKKHLPSESFDDFGQDLNIGVLFLKYILTFKDDWFKKSANKIITFGGFLTPIFKSIGLPLNPEKALTCDKLDFGTLVHMKIIAANKANNGHVYRFNYYQDGAYMTIPIPDKKKTKLSAGNIAFKHRGVTEGGVKRSDLAFHRKSERSEGESSTANNNAIVAASLDFVPRTKREEQLFNALKKEQNEAEERMRRQIEALRREMMGGIHSTSTNEAGSGPMESDATRTTEQNVETAIEALANLGKPRQIDDPNLKFYTRKRFHKSKGSN